MQHEFASDIAAKMLNRETWNRWATFHFEKSSTKLSAIASGVPQLSHFERQLLAPFAGQRLIHLQCHFGLDLFSLRLLGFQDACGVDFSEESIAIANRTKLVLGFDDIQFVCADVAALPVHLAHQFDVVFVNAGSLCWLPSIAQWAQGVRHCLRPGGHLIVFEVHPIIYAAQVNCEHRSLLLVHDYLERPEPYISVQSGSYDFSTEDQQFTTAEWNHGLGEILCSLLNTGFQICSVSELPFTSWRAFDWLVPDGEMWRLPDMMPRVPLSYAVQASLPLR